MELGITAGTWILLNQKDPTEVFLLNWDLVLLQVRGSFWPKRIQRGMIQQKVLTAGHPTLYFVISPSLFLTLEIFLLLKWQFFTFFLWKNTRNLSIFLSIHLSIYLFIYLTICTYEVPSIKNANLSIKHEGIKLQMCLIACKKRYYCCLSIPEIGWLENSTFHSQLSSTK